MEEELFSAIEKINKEKIEILNGKYYKLGKNIYTYIDYLKKFQIKKIFNNILNKLNKKKVKKLSSIKSYDDYEYKIINKNIDYKSKKIAVYTCIVGNYDNISIPLIKFDNVSFFIITDDANKYSQYKDIFDVIELPDTVKELNNIQKNRYAKFHPFYFFNNYDYSIYLDGNVRVVSDIRKFICNVNDKTGLAMHLHRERDCIYDEAKVCKILKRGDSTNIDIQMKKYHEEGFPIKYGMNEATIIVSNLKNDKAIHLLNEWYMEFINSNSLRDQLAWPYVLWKNKLKIYDVGIINKNIYKNEKIEMLKHN